MFLLKKEADASLYCGVLRDVTEELRTSADLENSRSVLKTIFHLSEEDMDGRRDLLEPNRAELLSPLSNALPIGMIGGYCEEGFPLYFASREQYRMMGYGSYQEFKTAIQGKVANTIYYEDLERVSRELGSSYHVGMEYVTTYRMPRKDGSLFWVLDKGRVVRAEDGRLAILSFCMDSQKIRTPQFLRWAAAVLVVVLLFFAFSWHNRQRIIRQNENYVQDNAVQKARQLDMMPF